MTSPILWVTERGHPSRPTVLFLHGFLGDGADWSSVVDLLEEDLRCLLIDLPGHGRSPAPARDSNPVADFTRALQQLIHQHVSDTYFLCGYSMGGRLALSALASGLKPLPRALILESAHPGITDPEQRSARYERDVALAARLRSNPVAFLREWYEQPLFASLRTKNALHSRLLSERETLNAPATAAALAAYSPGRFPDAWPILTRFTPPVLALAGSLDATYADIARQIARCAPSAQCAILDGAGHNVHRESPEAFAETLLNFIQSIKEGTSHD